MNLKKMVGSAIVVGMIGFGVQADPIKMEFLISSEVGGVETPITLTVSVEDNISKNFTGIGEANYLSITASVDNQAFGDILAVYVDFNTSVGTLPAQKSIVTVCSDNLTTPVSIVTNTNPFVTTNSDNEENDVVTLGIGNGNNDPYTLSGTQMTFDIGIQTGINGLGNNKGDINPATVYFNKNLGFSYQNIDKIGIRLQSVGISADARGGSSKFVYCPPTTNVPEPSLLSLLGLSLLGVGFIRRKMK